MMGNTRDIAPNLNKSARSTPVDYQEIEMDVDELEHQIWAGPGIEYPQQCYLNENRAEPSTNGLKGHCSAIELRARV